MSSDGEQVSDELILERVRAGDKEACALCIEKYSPLIYRLGLRLMKNEADAEDVMQETFLSAFKHIDSFEGRSGLGTWLYRIAYNEAMMRLRKPSPYKVSVEETMGTDGPIIIPEQLFDWCCLPEQDFETEEVRRRLEEALQRLPGKLRATFVLRDVEGMSTRETADILEISTDAVKTRLHRARLKLRAHLSAYFTARYERVEGS